MKDKISELVELIKNEKSGDFSDVSVRALEKWNFQYDWNLKEFKEFRNTEFAQGLRVDCTKSFSDFSVTHYKDTDFFIDTYYWNKREATIHDHNFEGSFIQLIGESEHTIYSFKEEKQFFNNSLTLGKLEKIKTERLVPGDIRKVPYGDDLIHQTIHLSDVCITLQPRTFSTNRNLQNYYPPNLRTDFQDENEKIENFYKNNKQLEANEFLKELFNITCQSDLFYLYLQASAIFSDLDKDLIKQILVNVEEKISKHPAFESATIAANTQKKNALKRSMLKDFHRSTSKN